MITYQSLMPWGKKYKDKPIKDIPPGYLLFCLQELRAPGAYMVGYRELYKYLLEHEDEYKEVVRKQHSK